ncbi:MAG: FtsX-like permease family protein [Desulfobacterales bacterium]|nr:FtsX-like permease family protein [Desulfobacterales bacterium]
MVHSRLILRQLVRSPSQAAIFVVCVSLSLITLVALNGFSESVDRLTARDARQLHGADLILRSHAPFAPALQNAVKALESSKQVKSARLHEFYSVVRNAAQDRSLLAGIKVVTQGYPFYGEVVLASGRPLHEALIPGRTVVEKGLLERLGLIIGDRLRVGRQQLIIQDVVLSEPDRPVRFFAFGPRVFVAAEDLEALDLVSKNSRVHHTLLLKVQAPGNIEALAQGLRLAALPGQERVNTFRSAESRIKRFFDNFMFFLNLIGVFVLLLSGIGIHSTLTAFLREKEHTIAIIKAVGATGRFVTAHFMTVVLVLGLAGTLIGMILGVALQSFLPTLFAGLLPPNLEVTISGRALAEGGILGLGVVALFAFLPLYRLKDVKPALIFRKAEDSPSRKKAYYISVLAITAFFFAVILRLLQDAAMGLYFLAGISGFILLTAATTQGLLAMLRHVRPRSLALRQALRGLFRPRNATAPIIVTLTASLAVLFTIHLVEKNLDATFIRAYPKNVPNLFFIDIQPDQVEPLTTLIGQKPAYFPIIRARIRTVNGRPIDPVAERQRRGDNLAREFNLTYRDHLLEDEEFIEGRTLFQDNAPGIQVSVMDTVADMAGLKIGDRVGFNIQGVPLEAKVSSIRRRLSQSIRPFFYFVFPEPVLKKAPHTLFTALRVDPEAIATLQNRVVAQFPNISAIDATQTLKTLSRVMDKLSGIIRFFALFSTAAGLLIVISSVLATRSARIREAVYYKVLGAKNRFVLGVFALENCLIALISALQALVLSEAASYLIGTWKLNIPVQPFLLSGLVMVGMTQILVIGTGLLASRSILAQKPDEYLRNSQE